MKNKKIPENSKIVFKGIIFNIHQWEQLQFDGSYKTFEIASRAYSVNVIPVLDNGKLLLTKQEQPREEFFYGLIGGRIDEGEEPVQAGKRELLEEAGYKAEKWELWFIDEPSNKLDWKVYTYIVKDVRSVASQFLDPGEKIELIQMEVEEYFKMILEDDTYRDKEIQRELLKCYYKNGNFDEIKKLFVNNQ